MPLLRVEVVQGALGVSVAVRFVLLVLPTSLLVGDFLTGHEEHGDEVSSVLIDDHDISTFLKLELHVVVRDNVLLQLPLLVTLG